jgi:hypothetical protein
MGTSNMISVVASDKEDCLAKLLQEFQFLPDQLPVGLGGTWTGGCEPWRKRSTKAVAVPAAAASCTLCGNTGCEGPGSAGCAQNSSTPLEDELTLELETDLTCLFRNSLWLHNQAVAQQREQATAASLSATAAATDDDASLSLSAGRQPPPPCGDPVVSAEQQHYLKEHKSRIVPVFAAPTAASPAGHDDDDDGDSVDGTDSGDDCENNRDMAKEKANATAAAKDKPQHHTADDVEKARRREMHTRI